MSFMQQGRFANVAKMQRWRGVNSKKQNSGARFFLPVWQRLVHLLHSTQHCWKVLIVSHINLSSQVIKYAGQASSPPMATSPKPSSCATTAPGGEIVPPEEFGVDHYLVLNPQHLVEPTSSTPSLSTLSTLLGYMSTKPTTLGGWLVFGQATVGVLGAGFILETKRIVKEKHLQVMGRSRRGPAQPATPVQPPDPTNGLPHATDQTRVRSDLPPLLHRDRRRLPPRHPPPHHPVSQGGSHAAGKTFASDPWSRCFKWPPCAPTVHRGHPGGVH